MAVARTSPSYRPAFRWTAPVRAFDFLTGIRSCSRCGAFPVRVERLELVSAPCPCDRCADAPAGTRRTALAWAHRGRCQ